MVNEIARYVVSQHRMLRMLSALIERTRGTPIPGVVALIGWLRSYLAVRPSDRQDGVVWIARLSNERQAIKAFSTRVPELQWTELRFQSRPAIAVLAALSRHLSPRRIFRLVRRMHRRYEFFKVLRVVEFIGFYTRYVEIFQAAQFSLAVMSSHSNPHGIAFNLAARKCGVPVILITHGMPISPVARLSYDLAVIHCEVARQTYLAEGCRMDRVLVHGRRQDSAPMTDTLPARLTVGIFLCKDVNEKTLQTLVQRLLDNAAVSQIIVRPHPKNLWLGLDAWIASTNDRRLVPSAAGGVSEDLNQVDVVLAGNSSVLVDAVTGGRPSGFVPGLDHGPPDLHTFVARGLIYEVDELDFDPQAMLRFYLRSDWPDVLRLFANIDEDEATVATRVGLAMRELARSRGNNDSKRGK